MSASLLDHFASLEDPRVERNQRHALLDIVLLTVCAVVSGADGWEAIEDFGREKLEWLRRFALFDNGVPSHDGIANVISRLTPKGFGACPAVGPKRWRVPREGRSSPWTATAPVARGIGAGGVRRCTWSAPGRAAIAALGEEATEEKSNEITAIPTLLELLDLQGCIVTIDAMGCQRAIAEQIRAQGGDYVLGLKGNQSTLQESVEDFFAIALAGDFAAVAHDFHGEIDKDHGRLEVRRYWVTEDLRTLPDNPLWAGLRSIGTVERRCTIGTTEMVEGRYLIDSTSPKPSASPTRCAVTGGWKTACIGDST